LLPDSRGGNILTSASAMLSTSSYLVPSVVELQTRYGTFVREEGEDQSIPQSLESIKTCLRQGGVLSQDYHGSSGFSP